MHKRIFILILFMVGYSVSSLHLKVVFLCSFGYDTEKILVRGQGGLPNCIETRLDMPSYCEKNIRSAHRENIVSKMANYSHNLVSKDF